MGYIRVSTVDQHTDRQLVEVSVDRTFTDMASGKDTERPKLAQMVAYVRSGDTVVVHSMDRLARNLDDLRGLVKTLTSKGVRIEFVKESLTFTADSSPMSQLLLNVMGAFAEFERSLIRERQREGVAIAKAKGVYKGRKRVLNADQIVVLHQRVALGAKKAVLAREFAVSRETVHRYLRGVTPIIRNDLPIAGSLVKRSITLTLWLEIFPYDKRVRTKKLMDDIEDWILSRYHAVTLYRGSRYRLTVQYSTFADLDAQMADLWSELSLRAEIRRCDVQGDIDDDQGRKWGSGDVHPEPAQYASLASVNSTT